MVRNVSRGNSGPAAAAQCSCRPSQLMHDGCERQLQALPLSASDCSAAESALCAPFLLPQSSCVEQNATEIVLTGCFSVP